jgi:sugar/nucleoside kinase (ribokinase family)
MTSGRDTLLEDWTAFREEWRSLHPDGWLQMDWHSLSLDEGETGPRMLRHVPDWEVWLKDLDLLQLTLDESFSLDGRRRSNLRDTRGLWMKVHAAGCQRLVVTDGARGFVYWDKDGSRVIAAFPQDHVADTTGCGDVLGASLLGLAGGAETYAVLQEAARNAASVLRSAGLTSLDELKGITGE